MAKNKHKKHDEKPEVVSPEEADRRGKINVIRGIVNDPEFQNMIRAPLLKETIKNSTIMACFLVGLLKLYEVTKEVIKFGWQIDLVVSLLLVFVGLIYIMRNTVFGNKNGDGAPSRSDP